MMIVRAVVVVAFLAVPAAAAPAKSAAPANPAAPSPSADAVREGLVRNADRARTEYDNACRDVDQALVNRFDREIELARKGSRNPAERAKAIEILGKEKALFLENGRLSFSASMRRPMMRHMQDRMAAGRALSDAYDRLIQHCLTKKYDAAAADYAAEKRTALAPKVVGKWAFKGVRNAVTWTCVMNSDGTTEKDKVKWYFEGENLVFVNKIPADAPPEGFLDKCVLDPEGQSLKGQSQVSVFTATLLTKE